MTGRKTAPAIEPIAKPKGDEVPQPAPNLMCADRSRLHPVKSRAVALLWTLCLACAASISTQPPEKVVVLGIDGMDQAPAKFVDQGRMPNFKALMAEGDFRPLQTTMPPQSPVAWSTFMTGLDPAGMAYLILSMSTRPGWRPTTRWPWRSREGTPQCGLMVVPDLRWRRAPPAQGQDLLADVG